MDGVNDPLIKVKVGADAMLFYFELVVILLCTKLAGDISVRLGQPSVLGKLIVGIISIRLYLVLLIVLN